MFLAIHSHFAQPGMICCPNRENPQPNFLIFGDLSHTNQNYPLAAINLKYNYHFPNIALGDSQDALTRLIPLKPFLPIQCTASPPSPRDWRRLTIKPANNTLQGRRCIFSNAHRFPKQIRKKIYRTLTIYRALTGRITLSRYFNTLY